jgi:alginate O-acetyltransferase complex protein AlgI
MGLTDIAVFGAFTLGAALFLSDRLRGLFLFTASILAVYVFQPPLPIRYLDFWIPTAALGLVTVTWAALAPREAHARRENWGAALWMGALILLLALSRGLLPTPGLTASLPPRLLPVAGALAIILVLAVLAGRAVPFKAFHWLGLAGLVLLLAALKSPQVSTLLAGGLRTLTGQSVQAATAFDIRWLGISYIAFRILHTLRERLSGRLPLVSLGEYVTYIFFFPALTAGPIDRLERFIEDLRRPLALSPEDWHFTARRLAAGLLKKFVLADSLALMALNAQNSTQIQSGGWAWVVLYAFSLQIFLDFSGYTDIALALARLLGVRLPENFNRPYLRANITQFWNNWHMTLTQWFRSYFFNPLTRALRERRRPAWVVILATQFATMTLIGLWHGVTLNFVLWGLWHGLGLFVHNRWLDAFRGRLAGRAVGSVRQRALAGLGLALTFHYVTLGWVWFVLPTPALAVQFFGRLLGQG